MLGQGTRFSIEVPVAAMGVSAAGIQTTMTELEDYLLGLKILVIEDDALASLALVSLLESWGCEVSLVEGLSQALTLIEQGLKPGVLISDYRLRGGENGLDAILYLRKLALGHLPACLLSGDTNPELIQSTRLVGLTLLHKPVRPAKLRNLLRHLSQEVGSKDLHVHALMGD
jgi:CheY-like chemotaxis protein